MTSGVYKYINGFRLFQQHIRLVLISQIILLAFNLTQLYQWCFLFPSRWQQLKLTSLWGECVLWMRLLLTIGGQTTIHYRDDSAGADSLATQDISGKWQKYSIFLFSSQNTTTFVCFTPSLTIRSCPTHDYSSVHVFSLRGCKQKIFLRCRFSLYNPSKHVFFPYYLTALASVCFPSGPEFSSSYEGGWGVGGHVIMSRSYIVWHEIDPRLDGDFFLLDVKLTSLNLFCAGKAAKFTSFENHPFNTSNGIMQERL